MEEIQLELDSTQFLEDTQNIDITSNESVVLTSEVDDVYVEIGTNEVNVDLSDPTINVVFNELTLGTTIPANRTTLNKITESGNLPLWEGDTWPGGHEILDANGNAVVQEPQLQFGGYGLEVTPKSGKTLVTSAGPQIYPGSHKWTDTPDNGISLTKIKQVVFPNTHWWNDAGLESPYMWWDDSDMRHHMIFPAYTTDTALHAVLGHATSINLIDWAVDAEPFFEPSGVPGDPDEKSVSGGTIIKHEGTYYLYYIGFTATGYEQGTTTACLATSSSLSGPWTRHGTVIGLGRRYSNYPADDTTYHADGIETVSSWRALDVWGIDTVIQVDEVWYAFFNATGWHLPNGRTIPGALNPAVERIGYATADSPLGPWTVQDADCPILAGLENAEFDRIIGEATIYWDGFKWVAQVYGSNEIHPSSIVQDGIAYTTREEFPLGWQWASYNPVLAPTAGGYDSFQAAKPCIYRYGGKIYHFYGCGTVPYDVTTNGIALAVSSTEIWKYLYADNGLVQEITVPDESSTITRRLKSLSGPTVEETFDDSRGVVLIDGKDISTRRKTLDPYAGTAVSDTFEIDVQSTGNTSNEVYGTNSSLTKWDNFNSGAYYPGKFAQFIAGAGTIAATNYGVYAELWAFHPGCVVTSHRTMASRVYVKRGATITTLTHFGAQVTVQADFTGSFTTDSAGYSIGATEITLIGTGTIAATDFISFDGGTTYLLVATGTTDSGVITLHVNTPLNVNLSATTHAVTFPTGAEILNEYFVDCPTMRGTTKVFIRNSTTTSSFHYGDFGFGGSTFGTSVVTIGASGVAAGSLAFSGSGLANNGTGAWLTVTGNEFEIYNSARTYSLLFNGTNIGRLSTTIAGSTSDADSCHKHGQYLTTATAASTYLAAATYFTSTVNGIFTKDATGTDASNSAIFGCGNTTGNGVSQSILPRRSRASSSGSGSNAYEEAVNAFSAVYLTNGVATNFLTLNSVAVSDGGGGQIDFSIYATDGTEGHVITGVACYAILRKSSGAPYWDCPAPTILANKSTNGTSTLTASFSLLTTSPGTNGNPIIQVTATCSLSVTNMWIRPVSIHNRANYTTPS